MKQVPLITKLRGAELVCCECGTKYGKYSVGCSTYHVGTCQVCDKTAAVTETRDFGYLQPGIDTEKAKIRWQSKEVAEYIASDEEYEGDQLASYELGEFCLMLTKEEVTYLMNCLDIISSAQVEEEDTYVFVSLETKIEELYADNCVEYSLSPVTAAYYKKYGTYGLSVEEAGHYQKFKENYEMLVELGFIDEAEVPSE